MDGAVEIPLFDPCSRCGGSGRLKSMHGERPCPDCNGSTAAANTIGKFHKNAGDTERAAALAVYPKTGTLRWKALQAFATAGPRGLTDVELSEKVGSYLYSIAPRRVELRDGGWVEDSGARRDTPHKVGATVWRITEKGKREAAR